MNNVAVILVIPLIALSCSAPDRSPSPSGEQNGASDETAIRAQVAALETAYNKRDTGALAALFTPDGDVMIVAGPRNSGQDAIRRTTEAAWSKTPSTRQIGLTVDSIRFLNDDVAIAECTARFSEGEPTQDRGTWVMVRRDGTWLVAALRVLPVQQS